MESRPNAILKYWLNFNRFRSQIQPVFHAPAFFRPSPFGAHDSPHPVRSNPAACCRLFKPPFSLHTKKRASAPAGFYPSRQNRPPCERGGQIALPEIHALKHSFQNSCFELPSKAFSQNSFGKIRPKNLPSKFFRQNRLANLPVQFI